MEKMDLILLGIFGLTIIAMGYAFISSEKVSNEIVKITDPDNCSQYSAWSLEEIECCRRMAKKTNDIKYCICETKIGLYYLCIENIAIRTNDTVLCKLLPKEYDIRYCIDKIEEK